MVAAHRTAGKWTIDHFLFLSANNPPEITNRIKIKWIIMIALAENL